MVTDTPATPADNPRHSLDVARQRLAAANEVARAQGIPARRLYNEAAAAIRTNRPTVANDLLDRFERLYT